MEAKRSVPGSLFGGMLLVAGSCIGAGMLALPILTGLAGFFPSLGMLFLAWAGMTFTALLLVEINSWFPRQVNLLTMAQKGLGKPGRWTAWTSYLFLFYALLVAYISASGSVFAAIFETIFHVAIPDWAASLFFTALFGWIIYLGTRPVDLVNRALMFGLIAAYLGMIGFGVFSIHPQYLLHWNPASLFSSLPVLVVSFGFHNLIPSLTAYMKQDMRRVRYTILGGSLIVLVVYLVWSLLVLGVLPYSGPNGILENYLKGNEATIALRTALGSTSIGYFAQAFAFFAIVTSFLAQGLTLTHFLADGFHIAPEKEKEASRWIIPLVLIPPLVFALLYPRIFLQALSFAGGICAMILFGVLPTLLVWNGRSQHSSSYRLMGGKPSLVLALLFSLFIIGCELVRIFS